ncbi:MAG: 3'-5' exonuclease [Clostridia bacterium]|nr:3'-5' exonuclease [Clostridia bacterium]
MNLVFFDIECASVYKTMAKICAFGYVLCDENFNIIKKEDILINPRGSFHLTDSKGEKGIVLPYKYNEFKKHPDFRAVYPQIKALLEDENNIVAGHATCNDVNYLNLETKRFSLPSFNFKFSDTQLIYMTKTGGFARQFGLEYITKDMNIEFTPHRAADDAYATMRIAQEFCKTENCNFSQLEKTLKITRGRIEDYRITKPRSQGSLEYNARMRAEKEERSRIRREFFIYLSRKKKKSSGELIGKKFNFSRIIEDNLELSKKLLDGIYAKGGVYTQRLAESNVYVPAAEDGTTRTRIALSTEGLQIMGLDELQELLK